MRILLSSLQRNCLVTSLGKQELEKSYNSESKVVLVMKIMRGRYVVMT